MKVSPIFKRGIFSCLFSIINTVFEHNLQHKPSKEKQKNKCNMENVEMN